MNFINKTGINNSFKQNTIRKTIHFSGVGVHNGRAVSVIIEPAKVDTGIVFQRIDIKHNNVIQAVIKNVDESKLCTKIKNSYGVSISTIEHLMAALNALKIDNALIKVNSPELPALDGSSYEYVKKVIKSGIKAQEKNRQFIKILKKVQVRSGDRFISISPSNKLSINISINYPNTIIGQSNYFYLHNEDNFIENLSRARTYTLFEDIEKMRTAGLAIGGNLNNAIVVDKYKILNPDGLRLDKEFVKHKALDCIGDFYLLGMQLLGNVTCHAPGHNLNQMLLKEILKDKKNYKIEHSITDQNIDNFFDLVDEDHSSQNIIHVA